MFISEKNSGFGIKSFVDTYALAIARELEVILNSKGVDAEGSRGRLAAHMNNFEIKKKKCPSFNHISDAIVKLSHFGFYLRDYKDGILNYLIEKKRSWNNKNLIGHTDYNKQKEPLLGEKHNNDLVAYVYVGEMHKLITRFIEYKDSDKVDDLKKATKNKNHSSLFDFLNETWNEVSTQRIHDHSGLFDFQEWIMSANDEDPRKSTNWRNIDCNTDKNVSRDYISIEDTWQMIQSLITISPLDNIYDDKGTFTSQNTYGTVLENLLNSKSPLLISTDGGLTKKNILNKVREKTPKSLHIVNSNILPFI